MYGPFWGCGPGFPYPDGPGLNLDWVLRIVGNMQNQVNQIMEYFDEFEKKIQETVDAAVTEALAPMKQQLLQFQAQLSDFQSQVQLVTDQMAALESKHEVDIQKLQNEIDELKFNLPDFINPESGTLMELQQILFNLYYSGFDTYITPDEFDALEITPDEFDAIGITPDQYDRNAKTILTQAVNQLRNGG